LNSVDAEPTVWNLNFGHSRERTAALAELLIKIRRDD